MSNDKDTVPGLGFKDKDKALETIKNLDGRDPDYQKLAVKGLIGRAKRTLQVTKAEDKLTNIKEALDVFEKWLKDFEKLHIPNWSYLPLATVETFVRMRKHFELNDKQVDDFHEAYRSVEGDYKKLRTVASGDEKPTWDIVRNNELKQLMKVVEDESPDLWDSNDLPTKIHTQLLMWAYSPEASKIKKTLSSLAEKMDKHIKSDDTDKSEENAENESDSDEAKENDVKEEKKSLKRKSNGNAEDEEGSPEKKRAVE